MLFGSWKGVFELLQQWRWESGRDLKCEIGDQFMLLRVYLFGKAEAKFATGKEDIMASEDVKTSHDKQMWIKYYCEECETWETREMFEVTKLSVAQATPAGACALWSWGCSKLVRHGSFQTFRVDQLNNADGHDVPNLDFPSIESPATTRPFREVILQLKLCDTFVVTLIKQTRIIDELLVPCISVHFRIVLWEGFCKLILALIEIGIPKSA